MKKQFAIFFALLFISMFSFSQDQATIQYEEIQKNIEDPSSPYYYHKLIERYHSGDETLTTEDYRHLYYGFTFQDEYRPYERNPLDMQITELLPTATTEDDFDELKGLASLYLEVNPFSLKLLNYLEHFNYNVSDFDEAENEILRTKSKGIIDAILSTGDGKSIKTGYSVNHPSDEYMVMRHLKLKPTKTTTKTHYDAFDVAENATGFEKIYFDVFRMTQVGTKQLGVTALDIEDGSDVQINAKGLVVGSKDELIEFVPGGKSILFEQKVDVDADGDIDWIIVTKEDAEAETSNFDGGHPKYRTLLILTRNKEGVLENKTTSDRVIPCVDCGGTNEDPLHTIEVTEKKMKIVSKGGDLMKWERETEFEYSNNEWVLSKETFSTYRKGKRKKMQTDVETKEDFGKILLTEFDYYKLLQ